MGGKVVNCGCGSIQETTNIGINLGFTCEVEVTSINLGVSIGGSFPVTTSRVWDGFVQVCPMNEIEGNFEDISGNDLDLISVVPSVPDEGVYCLNSQYFEEVNQKGPLLKSDPDSINGPFSFSCWIYIPYRFKPRTIYSRGDCFAIKTSFLNHLISEFKTAERTIEVFSNRVLEENRWYHIATEYTGSECNLYINGTFAGTDSVSGVLPTTLGNQCGSKISGSYFTGNIQEVRLSAFVPGVSWFENEHKNYCGTLVSVEDEESAWLD